MLKIYELHPLPEQVQESFYGKALVYVDEDGTETLYSYKTPIGKHIKAFWRLDKRGFENLD